MLSDIELYRFYEAGKPHGLTQRKMAKFLGMEFNALHGKLWRFQKKEEPRGVQLTHKTYPRVELKSAVFDIETTDFSTGGINAHMICCCVLPLDSEKAISTVIHFEENRNDKRLLKETLEMLSEYTILIGHNASAFDTGWLASRAAYHGLAIPDNRWLVYDTYQAAKRMALKSDRKSLAFLSDFFQFEYVKTAIYPTSHSMIDSPVEEEFNKARTDILYHCVEDVKANRKLFDALWPLDKTMTGLPVAKRLL